jgi:hypothetical protein
MPPHVIKLRIAVHVEDLSDAAHIAAGGEPLEQRRGIGPRQIRSADDAVRVAARTWRIGAGLQPLDLEQRIGGIGLDVHRAQDLDLAGIGEQCRHIVDSRQQSIVARVGDLRLGEPGVVDARAVPQMHVRIDHLQRARARGRAHCRFTNSPPSTSTAAPVT